MVGGRVALKTEGGRRHARIEAGATGVGEKKR